MGTIIAISFTATIIIILLAAGKIKAPSVKLGKKITTIFTTKKIRGPLVNDNKKNNSRSWFWIIAIPAGGIIVFVLWFFDPFSGCTKQIPKPETNTNIATQSNKELLELMDEGYVSSGTPWETQKIDYKYKFRTDGHAYNLQFSKRGGGWTKPIPIPKEGDYNLPLPDDATQGPVLVTAGPNETEPFRVQLYKRI